MGNALMDQEKSLSKMGIGISASFIMDCSLAKVNLYGLTALSMKDNLQIIESLGRVLIHGLMDPTMKDKSKMVSGMGMASTK